MRYDLVFIDPPFAHDWMERIWPLLPNVLAPDALVYIESETPIQAPDQYGILRQDKAGQVHYHLLRFAAMQKTVNNAEFSGTPAPLPRTPTCQLEPLTRMHHDHSCLPRHLRPPDPRP